MQNCYIFQNVFNIKGDRIAIDAINYNEALSVLLLKGSPFDREFYLETILPETAIKIASCPFILPIPQNSNL